MIYGKYKNESAAIDIETTKMDGRVAVIGISGFANGEDYFEPLIRDIDLNKANLKKALRGIKLILTFNGCKHDIPKLESEFGAIFGARWHADLYKLLQLKNRQKISLLAIEKKLGIKRPAKYEKHNALKWWQAFEFTGGKTHLSNLVSYNEWDTRSLHKVAELFV